MKRQIVIFLIATIIALGIVLSAAFGEETYTLKAGISIDKVPKDLYGTWRVSSKLLTTSNSELYKKNSVDLWNLSRTDNVITLSNPFSGAKASITVSEVSGNSIRFSKIGNFDNNKLTDTVKLELGKESFTGVNYLKLDTISDIDGSVLKSESATYALTGEKISGASIK